MSLRFCWPEDRADPELQARLFPADLGLPEHVQAAARDILRDVRARGDVALIELSARFDEASLTQESLRVEVETIAASAARAPEDLRAALKISIDNVRRFHAALPPSGCEMPGPGGGQVALRWRPVSAAALYVPGGRAAYPSTVVMNAVPAQIAGVPRLAVFTVPGAIEDNPAVACALELLGLDEVYRVGGAQAVAAAAYGTQSIPGVQVIVGPGNAYVAAAKQQVLGRVGIDSVAGPSEVLILADETADPRFMALDLIAQAEHDPLARCILATTSEALADAVQAELHRLLPETARKAIAEPAWREHGAIIVAPDVEALVQICDLMAPEHLQVVLSEPPDLDRLVAGAIFVGNHAPTAVGDYAAGPNHVLPTGGTARFQGPLGPHIFMRPSTVVHGTREMMAALAAPAARIADHEGLFGHAAALRARDEET